MAVIKLHEHRDARIQILKNLDIELRIVETKNGEYLTNSLFNMTQLLRHHPYFKNRIVYDNFAHELLWTNDVGEKERLEDYHVDKIRYNCEDRFGVAFKSPDIWSALEIVGKENGINPIKEYFVSIANKWKPGDKKRAEYLLSRYMGANKKEQTKLDKAINRAYSLRWLISIIARAHATVQNPVKVDTVLVLYGGQGIGKSTALETICLADTFGRKYFGDSELAMDKYRDSVQSIQGKLIYELQELQKRSKAVETEKAFLSMQIDDVRLPYKRSNQRFARHTVFCATTNKKNVLHDATGSRRFWCVDLGTKKINIKKLKKDLPLIWAEAFHWYKQGYEWWLDDKEELQRIASAEDFTDPHPLTDSVLEAADLLKQPVTVAEIIEHLYKNIDPTKENHKHLDKSTRQNQNIISDILRSDGWIYARRKSKQGNKRVRGWFKDV